MKIINGIVKLSRLDAFENARLRLPIVIEAASDANFQDEPTALLRVQLCTLAHSDVQSVELTHAVDAVYLYVCLYRCSFRCLVSCSSTGGEHEGEWVSKTSS